MATVLIILFALVLLAIVLGGLLWAASAFARFVAAFFPQADSSAR